MFRLKYKYNFLEIELDALGSEEALLKIMVLCALTGSVEVIYIV